MIRDLIYDFPDAGYLILFLFPLFFLYWNLDHYRQKTIQSYTSLSLSRKLVLPRSRFFSLLKAGLLCLAWLFCCLAFMQPKGNLNYSSTETANGQGQSQEISLKYKAHDVIFLIDTSGSMLVKDTPDNQTRLEEAKKIAGQIIGQLKGENVALYAFTSEIIPFVPPTLDYLFFLLRLKQMQISGEDTQGTDYSKIFNELKEKAFTSDSKLYTVILISDGGDNQIEKLQGAAQEQAIQKLIQTLPNAKEHQLRLFTIGVGSIKGGVVPGVTSEGKPVLSQLQNDFLQQMASQARGVYYQADTLPSWNLAHDLIDKMGQDSPYEEGRSLASGRTVAPAKQDEMSYQLYYQIPLGIALILLLLYFILPDVRSA